MTWLAATSRYDSILCKVLLAAVAITDGKAEASAITTIDTADPGTDHGRMALTLGCELAKANGHSAAMLWPEQSDAAGAICASAGPDGSDCFNTGVCIVPGTPGPDEMACIHDAMSAMDDILSSHDQDVRYTGDTAADDMADRVLALHKSPLEEPVIQDASTILVDMMANRVLSFYEGAPDGNDAQDAGTEPAGIGPEMIRIWKDSHDKESVERLFQAFTGHAFTQYLKFCEAQTTKK